MDDVAEKLAKQLALAEKTLFALEAYLAQARQVITQTRAILKDGERAAGPPGQAGDLVE